jgi:hypothetical protein
MKNSDAIYYSGILLTSEKIAMIQGKSEVASVLKKDIRAISLEEGHQSERPILQVIFGIAVLFIPLFTILYILGGLIAGEPLRIPNTPIKTPPHLRNMPITSAGTFARDGAPSNKARLLAKGAA